MTSFKPLKRQLAATVLWLAVLGGCYAELTSHKSAVSYLFGGWLITSVYQTIGHYRHGYWTALTDEGIEIRGRRIVPVAWKAVLSIEIKQHFLSTKIYVHLRGERKVLLPAPYTGHLLRRDKGFPDKVKAIQTAYALAAGQIPRPPQRIAQG